MQNCWEEDRQAREDHNDLFLATSLQSMQFLSHKMEIQARQASSVLLSAFVSFTGETKFVKSRKNLSQCSLHVLLYVSRKWRKQMNANNREDKKTITTELTANVLKTEDHNTHTAKENPFIFN